MIHIKRFRLLGGGYSGPRTVWELVDSRDLGIYVMIVTGNIPEPGLLVLAPGFDIEPALPPARAHSWITTTGATLSGNLPILPPAQNPIRDSRRCRWVPIRGHGGLLGFSYMFLRPLLFLGLPPLTGD